MTHFSVKAHYLSQSKSKLIERQSLTLSHCVITGYFLLLFFTDNIQKAPSAVDLFKGLDDVAADAVEIFI